MRAVQSAGSDAVVLGLDPAIAEKINEIAPQTRRSIREAARAAERRSHILASASLAALVGTAAGSLAFSNNDDAANSFVADPATTTTQIKRISDVTAASRSEARTDLSSSSVTAQSTNEGGWGLSNSDSTLDAKLMNRNNANNPVVSALVDADGDAVPAGAWAASASALGYWVDNTPRHVGDAVVFAPGQADADGAYGHVAVLEKINADGSIEISESNAKGLGVISTRTFSAAEAGKFQYVHY